MKTVEILGANRFENYTKIRDGSRAIIIQDGKILLTHELNSGWWLLPGGGMEEGETPEECVIREVEEETGVIVRTLRQVLFMHAENEFRERRAFCRDDKPGSRGGSGRVRSRTAYGIVSFLRNVNDVETVVLLRRKKVDGYIEVNLETNG